MQITAIEKHRGFQFPPEYRALLSVLGGVDRPTLGVFYVDDTNQEVMTRWRLYNWAEPSPDLEQMLEWPLEGLLFDVEMNNLWLESWGPRPDQLEDQFSRVRELVNAAPRLIPVAGHRYMLEYGWKGNPFHGLLSVWQSDIMWMGVGLQGLLIGELGGLFDRNHWEEPIAHTLFSEQETPEITREQMAEVPFWGELVLRAGNFVIQHDLDN